MDRVVYNIGLLTQNGVETLAGAIDVPWNTDDIIESSRGLRDNIAAFSDAA
jgi:hypothetical protein